MRRRDLIGLALETLRLHRLRTTLTLVAIAIGVTSVLLLTALGEAAKGFVIQEFANLGSNLVIVLPGRTETSGMPTFGGTTRDLTVEDWEAAVRRAGAVRRGAPLAIGSATMEFEGRTRDIMVAGTTSELLEVRNLRVALGQFLPAGDPRHGDRVVVVGQTVQRELFEGANPLGKAVRIGEWRFRVIGVYAPKGRSLGIDWDDAALVPVSTGMRMFNLTGLFRVMLEARDAESVQVAIAQVRQILRERHDGDEDFTIISQDAMLGTFSTIIDALTAFLAGIAAVSLGVAGIGIMNVMLVSVSERTREIGLLKALGGRRRQILDLFLAEAVMLSGSGAVAGTLLGVAVIGTAAAIWPEFPLRPGAAWIATVVILALAAGIGFGLLPARSAARLDVVEALRGKR